MANSGFGRQTGAVIVREFRDSDADAAYALCRLAFGGPRVPEGSNRHYGGWRAHVAEVDGRLAGHLRLHDHRQVFGGRADSYCA